ncbi:MAG: NAD(P)-dependent oxidoreductase [Cellvibrionaceae bacterium]|nr:NAD(P)-dependent oxidoreductase [Cellvibrionaceae bacterium]
MHQKVAFIGLGVMGYPMAGHLQKAGCEVTVYNRNGEVARRWEQEYGGLAAPTPRAAAEGAEIVFTCVGEDKDVREVCLGEQGAFAGMKVDSVLVDHTTASAELARELYLQAKERKLHFLDAPVSGGQAGAINGALTIMVGGDVTVFNHVNPVLDHYARSCKLLGPAGSGQLCKMVNQICIAGLVEGLAEGLNFAERAGLDPYQVVDVISKGAAQSWQMENRYRTMLAGDYDHGFAVDWMRKDLSIVMAEAARIKAAVPVTALVDQFYNEVQLQGGGRWDTSSLLARLKSQAR